MWRARSRKDKPAEKAVHKWNVFRAVCAAKARIGVSERALAVLDALLSFHPETVLSRRRPDRLSLEPAARAARAWHGAGDAAAPLAALSIAACYPPRQPQWQTLRPQRAGEGTIENAFGFDLGPLVARADEFEAWAEEIRAEERALKLVRERITLCRRDIAKMIATGIEDGVAVHCGRNGPTDWLGFHALYRSL